MRTERFLIFKQLFLCAFSIQLHNLGNSLGQEKMHKQKPIVCATRNDSILNHNVVLFACLIVFFLLLLIKPFVVLLQLLFSYYRLHCITGQDSENVFFMYIDNVHINNTAFAPITRRNNNEYGNHNDIKPYLQRRERQRVKAAFSTLPCRMLTSSCSPQPRHRDTFMTPVPFLHYFTKNTKSSQPS